jgi:hypothetical protein
MDPVNPLLYIYSVFFVGIIWLIYTIVFDKSGMNKLVNVLRTSFTSNAQPTQYNADKS